MDEDSKIIAKMLTNQVTNLNKEQIDKRDVPIDEEIFKGMYCTCVTIVFNTDYDLGV